MGYIKHHAIICTFSSAKDCAEAHLKAEELYRQMHGAPGQLADPKDQISPVMVSPINGYATFFIGPDGSKEYWDDSDKGDEFRAEFIKYLNTLEWPPKWVEVCYYDEQAAPHIIDHLLN